MESKDSTTSTSTTSDVVVVVKQESRVVLFGIDLNEIPSSSSTETLPTPTIDAYDVVRSVHGNPRRPFRAVTDLSSEVRDVPCVCGRLEARGGVVVCDGCDRWFHLSCAGMRSRQAITLDDWFCGVCVGNGVRSIRWPLGPVGVGGAAPPPVQPKRSGVRLLLDINASPPSDGEEAEEEIEELQQQPRLQNLGENYFSGFQFSTSMTYPGFWYPGTGFDLQRESGMMVHPVKSGPEKIVNRKMIMSKSSEEANLNSTPRGRFRGNNTNAPVKRKELARVSRINSSNQEARKNACSGDLSSEVEISEPYSSSFGSVRVAEVQQVGNGGCDSQQLNDGLPVQFEDLFILCLGKIDSRPSYHNSSQIWPVGYRSSWHDKVTGSLFTCDVLDGGNAGPVFRVRRCPCSTSLIPNGSTVLLRLSLDQSNIKDNEKSDEAIVSEMGYAEDTNIEMILSDPSPLEQDLLSCFGGYSSESCELQTKDGLPPQDNCFSRGPGEHLYNYSGLKDEIGEFFAEGRSSSLVWGKISDMLVDACREAYKRSGSLQFFCNHALDGIHSPCSDFVDANNKGSVGSLPKFCSSSGPIDIPRVIRGDYELDDSCKALATWLNQDRFGLDTEFVQEIIEQLPGCHTCSHYEFLDKRSDYSTLQTVGSGFLLAKRKSRAYGEEEEAVDGLFKACKKLRKHSLVQDSRIEVHYPPPGKPLSLKLPDELVGDVLQVCELLWRFYEVLGLKEPLLFEELEEELLNPWSDGLNVLGKPDKNIQEKRDLSLRKCVESIDHTVSITGDSDPTVAGEHPHKFVKIETGPAKEAAQARLASRTYYRCTGVALTKAHTSLLKILVGELQAKAAALIDPNFDNGELKSRRGRKKDADNSVPMKKLKMDILPINELTWPELARRYVLAVLSMDGNLDSSEITSRDGIKLFRCLQGDGGLLCGSLTGVGGMETDALLLAGATKQIFGSLNREHDIWPLEDKDADAAGSSETITEKVNTVPEWALVLEPVRKLPTNVGTRIRRCVYDALTKDPPEWAKKILEHSISKEVYKGNASGPTKKAVLSVLADVYSEAPQHKPDKVKKAKSVQTVSDMIMKQCRCVLRHAASGDEAKVFCNLLGTTSLNPNDNEDEGILGSPAMVSRPLDFRTVDLRLAAGSYNGSHEAFVEDVREVWQNLRTAFRDRPDLAHLAETLSQNFESLYEKEVLTVVQKVSEHADPQYLSAAVKKELNELVCGHEIPKAPWDEGVCKMCGIDKDDESVLLCDTCDSEYHTYCLNPPLARIPEGNWYCPSCVARQDNNQDLPKHTHLIWQRRRKRYQGEGTRAFSEALNRLAAAMEEKEYWECSLEERVFLLKFLCDEVLNSGIIREHLDHCADMSADLQQKLRPLSIELKNLKFKEETLAARVTKENMLNGIGEAGREGMNTVLTNHGRWTGQRQSVNNKYSHGAAFPGNLLDLDDVPEENELNDLNRNPCWSFSQSFSENHCNGSRTQNVKLADLEGQTKDVLTVMDNRHMFDNLFPDMVSMKTDESNKQSVPDLISQQSQMDALGEELTSKNSLDRKTVADMETDHTLQSNVEVLRGSCISVDIKRTQLAENVALIPANSDNLFSGSHSIVQPGIINEVQVYNQQLDTVKNEISHMQDSICSMESQLFKLSMRRDFLGRDTAGRLYWALSKPGKFPWLVVDGNIAVQENRSRQKEQGSPYLPSESKTYPSSREYKASSIFAYGSHDGALELSSWVSYDSDVEVQELVGWLSSSDPRERELKESIYQMQRLRSQDSQPAKNHSTDDCEVIGSKSSSYENAASLISIATKAACLLENKYGPCLESEAPDIPKKRGRKMKITQEEKMYRCECLEPVWPSRYHCLSCHHTFYTNVELDGHNDGKCNLVLPASEDTKDTDDHSKGKGKMRIETTWEENADEMDVAEASRSGKLDISSRVVQFQKGMCPFNLEDICKKFITKDSNRELVQEVGLIGSNGIPSFVSSTSPYLHDPTLILDSALKNESDKVVGQTTGELVSLQQSRAVPNSSGYNNSNDLLKRCAGSSSSAEASKVQLSECLNIKKESSSSLNKIIPELEVDGNYCILPEASTRPLVGKVSQILRRLKTNLLDMDAALPEEALRSSKAHSSKRCAWRTFVKSADSIFEMVQATIIFQEMIKTEYLRNGWWYWSSLTAAAKTSTISSLALRIYTLDATIIYQKTLPGLDTSHPTTDIPKLDGLKSGKKKKDTEG